MLSGKKVGISRQSGKLSENRHGEQASSTLVHSSEEQVDCIGLYYSVHCVHSSFYNVIDIIYFAMPITISHLKH